MADVTLDDTYEASYKNVTFIVDSSSISGGRKDVVHDFVNSGKQVIEDLGLRRRDYNLTTIITGADFLDRKSNLLAVLEGGGKGTLVHPFEGTILDIVVRTFTLVEDFAKFGVAKFEIQFAPSDDVSSPEPAKPQVYEVRELVTVLNNVIIEAMNDDYLTTPSLTGSIENSIQKGQDFIDEFTESTRGTAGVVNTINSLNEQIISFNDSIASLVQNPALLSSSINSLFVTANAAFNSSLEMLGMMESLFNFGSDDVDQLNISTAAINQINQNNDIFNYAINSFALGNSYLQLVETQFTTVTDIERQETILEEQYDLITGGQNLSSSVRTAMTNLRNVTSEVIADIKTTTPDLIGIEVVNETTIRKLEFLYYNGNTRTDELISINDIQNPSFVSGNLEILNDNI